MAVVAMFDPRHRAGNALAVDAHLGPASVVYDTAPPQSGSSVVGVDPTRLADSHGESSDGRHASNDSNDDDDEDDDEKRGSAKGSSKRRRIAKEHEKKFICPAADCDKRYSRAEHLYRHQLNHTPKQIYRCDHPGCDRRFVRQDLCARHKERHNSRESGLVRTTKSRYDLPVTYNDLPPGTVALRNKLAESRRDSQQNEQDVLRAKADPGSMSPSSVRHASVAIQDHRPYLKQDHTHATNGHHIPAMAPFLQNERPPRSQTMPENSHAYAVTHSPNRYPEPYAPQAAATQGQYTPAITQAAQYTSGPPMYAAFPPHHTQAQAMRDTTAFSPMYQQQATSNMQYMSPTVTAQQPLPGVTPFAPPFQTGIQVSQASMRNPMALSSPIPDHLFVPANMTTAGFAHNMGESSIPVFNNEIYNNAPFVSADDFTQWLFDNEQGFNAALAGPDMLNEEAAGLRGHNPHDVSNQRLDQQYHRRPSGGENSGEATARPGASNNPPSKDFGPPRAFESSISHTRRKNLLQYMIETFHDRNHAQVTEYRQSIFSGDLDRYPHALCHHMMETYLAMFWANVHPQLPILHKPTFSADTCPDFLLLTLLALGASNLDPSHGMEMRQRTSDLSFFLAWHTRFRIYQEPDFGPPAKLWIFQALLLLEIFEKMYSSRSLHERSHIHHATTITLMRRGSALIGRYSQDFPPYSAASSDPSSSISGPGDTRTPPIIPPPSAAAAASGLHTSNAEWNHWIDIEATRRIAFAAFIVDTTHAHMFGHSAVMVAHEMRIVMPCDEAMWAAESFAEVQAIKARLEQQDYRQVSFLEALKKTLNCSPVRTNTFGRVSLMAGLLSVSWHMKMQDVRVSSVGIGQAGAWGKQLLRAFDFWKQDFDASLGDCHNGLGGEVVAAAARAALPGLGRGELDRDNVFEARTVLHHLAHMAMHCDVLDCMMYAGATRLLGRVITHQDRAAARRRMVETWAPSARARDSTFYALRFLSSALVPDDRDDNNNSNNNNDDDDDDDDDDNRNTTTTTNTHNGGGSGNDGAAGGERSPATFEYVARHDVLLNRPWVLYLAAMVVWSYGYAREGALPDPEMVQGLRTEEAQVRDMRSFLRRMAQGESPNDLEKIKGKNRPLGLLMLLRQTFLKARWELMHEAAGLMGACISMLAPGVRWEGMDDRATGR